MRSQEVLAWQEFSGITRMIEPKIMRRYEITEFVDRNMKVLPFRSMTEDEWFDNGSSDL